jgi:hypothetical protein
MPGLVRPGGSNLRFSFSGTSIYGRVLISFCYVENINSDSSLPFLVSLAAIIIEIRREMLPATSWIPVYTIFCLASLVRFEVQNSHIDSQGDHQAANGSLYSCSCADNIWWADGEIHDSVNRASQCYKRLHRLKLAISNQHRGNLSHK